ncbi:GerAB/ArcD/ProY family transporter [Paenibacillus sp. JDR-2]|uniref:GerAB/ArcD/ProY family transporter n=1 Tax=Paenibacillus sp. (strain JDR-2) TaxID=324057 RepID=UPI000166A7EE|nr:GerAB/ArcD/ProY family transporter [Paenibacillus sp. JDR-2]ACS99986.1 Spore germination protein [Paenibacillus sp. JDR-2]
MNKLKTIIMFFLLHLASIFAIFPERMMSSAPRGHWMAVLLLFLAELLALWFYLKALSYFPERSIVEVCRAAVGSWGTRLIILPFLCFLIIELVLLTYYESIEIKTVLLQKTPISATSALFVAICLYAAWKGLTVMIRASIGWFLLCMPFFIFSMLISIKNFEFRYIFPMWDSGMHFLFHPDFYVGTVIFAGYLFLGMTTSHFRIGFGLASAAIGLVFLCALASVYIPLLIFGQETAVHMEYPMLMASDTVDLEWVVFDWLPNFYVVSSSALGVLKVSVLLWMFVAILTQLFMPKVNSRWILVIICASLYISCQWMPNEDTLNKYLYLNSYFCLYATIVFPVLVYLMALWRRKKVTV